MSKIKSFFKTTAAVVHDISVLTMEHLFDDPVANFYTSFIGGLIITAILGAVSMVTIPLVIAAFVVPVLLLNAFIGTAELIYHVREANRAERMKKQRARRKKKENKKTNKKNRKEKKTKINENSDIPKNENNKDFKNNTNQKSAPLNNSINKSKENNTKKHGI